jgi:hypothetical protein
MSSNFRSSDNRFSQYFNFNPNKEFIINEDDNEDEMSEVMNHFQEESRRYTAISRTHNKSEDNIEINSILQAVENQDSF